MTAFPAEEKVHSERKPRFFYGWWIVIAFALINFYIGGTYSYGFTAFFNPIVDHFGWSYGAISIILALRGMETGIGAPIMGYLVDRLGPRKVAFSGVVISGFAFIGLSRVNSMAMFIVAIFVLALGVEACSGLVVPPAAVANWFYKKIGKAIALTAVGFGFGGILVRAVVWMIDQYGWQTSLVIIGIGMWAFCLPLSLLARHKPEQYGYLPDGEVAASPSKSEAAKTDSIEPAWIEYTAREAMRTSAFWLLIIVSFLGQMAITALIVHVMPALDSVGISRGVAGFVVTSLTLSSIVGRLGYGWLADVLDKKKLFAIILAIQAIGIFIFAYAHSVWTLIPFLVTFGPAYGGQQVLRSAIQREYFGRSAFGTIQGAVAVGSIASGLIATSAAGIIFDARDSYYLAWLAFAIASALAVPLALALKAPQRARSTKNHI